MQLTALNGILTKTLNQVTLQLQYWDLLRFLTYLNIIFIKEAKMKNATPRKNKKLKRYISFVMAMLMDYSFDDWVPSSPQKLVFISAITNCCVYVISLSVVFNSLSPHGLQPARLFCPWNFTGKNPGAGCHFLLKGISSQGRSTFQGLFLSIWLFHTLYPHTSTTEKLYFLLDSSRFPKGHAFLRLSPKVGSRLRLHSPWLK